MFVEDYSNNGTFVDGVLVGKNHKLPLVNNAVVALAEPRNKGGSDWGSVQAQNRESGPGLTVFVSPVFVFIDLISDDQSSLPKELQEKYVLTRRIGT